MLLGHVGAGFAGKSFVKKGPLWVYIFAALIPDIIAMVFIILKIQSKALFFSHSLVMTSIYGLVFSGLIFLIYKNIFSSIVVFALTLSHWLFDLISWPLEAIGMNSEISFFTPDITYGFGLYKTVFGAVITEILLLGIGVLLYVLQIRRNRVKK